jgi:hypothetical protein
MLTPGLLQSAFLRATQSMCGAAQRWQSDAVTGLTDQQLASRLAYELGSYGGSSANGLDVEYTAEGLRIWASDTGFVRRTKDGPALQGQATISFARHVYGIANPADGQMKLF